MSRGPALKKDAIIEVCERLEKSKDKMNIALSAGVGFESVERVKRMLNRAKIAESYEDYESVAISSRCGCLMYETIWEYVHGKDAEPEEESPKQEQLAICNLDLTEVVQLLTKIAQQQKSFEGTISGISKTLERIESEMR